MKVTSSKLILHLHLQRLASDQRFPDRLAHPLQKDSLTFPVLGLRQRILLQWMGRRPDDSWVPVRDCLFTTVSHFVHEKCDFGVDTRIVPRLVPWIFPWMVDQQHISEPVGKGFVDGSET